MGKGENKVVALLIGIFRGKKKCKKLQKNLHSKKNVCTFATQNTEGAIAQLVEQRTENPCVPGSIPGGTT